MRKLATATPARISDAVDARPPPDGAEGVGERDGGEGADERGERRADRASIEPSAAPTITIVTPRPAPAAAPSRYGSASGLRNTPW